MFLYLVLYSYTQKLSGPNENTSSAVTSSTEVGLSSSVIVSLFLIIGLWSVFETDTPSTFFPRICVFLMEMLSSVIMFMRSWQCFAYLEEQGRRSLWQWWIMLVSSNFWLILESFFGWDKLLWVTPSCCGQITTYASCQESDFWYIFSLFRL